MLNASIGKLAVRSIGKRAVSAFADVKDNCDSSQFMAVQKAAAFALDDDKIAVATVAKY